jgi:NAD(P)-dependent dehydrogenase (short-subunit alcohol dehydrogenase family)
MRLAKKVALITGGTRMGAAVAEVLGQRGCRIVLTWRRSKLAAETTAQALKKTGISALAIQCDIAKPDSVRKALKTAVKRFGRLDVLVNLASIYERNELAKPGSLESWDDHVSGNAKAAFDLTLAAAPWLRQSGEGRVIHISDWTSASGRPRYLDYSAYYVSKSAIKALTEALALELAPQILVNAIAPGPMIPPEGLTRQEDRAVRKATPLGRWGGPQEIAKAVAFLVETDFVTGETIRVDGGRHLI